MSFLSGVSSFIHVAFGAAGLIAFWVPVFAKKGAVNHVRFGKIFVWSAYVVLASAGISLTVRALNMWQLGIGVAEEPRAIAFMVFLGYLTFVTFVTFVTFDPFDPFVTCSVFGVCGFFFFHFWWFWWCFWCFWCFWWFWWFLAFLVY